MAHPRPATISAFSKPAPIAGMAYAVGASCAARRRCSAAATRGTMKASSAASRCSMAARVNWLAGGGCAASLQCLACRWSRSLR